MPSPAITTIIKMVESLPDELQEQLVEYVRAYIAEIEEEKRWDQSFFLEDVYGDNFSTPSLC